MSDRHSAEKLFNDLIHDFRAGVLPTIIENWDHLHESEQQQFNRMNNFFVASIFLLDWLTQLKKQLSCGNLMYCQRKMLLPLLTLKG